MKRRSICCFSFGLLYLYCHRSHLPRLQLPPDGHCRRTVPCRNRNAGRRRLRRFPLAFQMMVSAVLITAIELYSGMFSLRVLHYRMWDYSALPFSFCDGMICPWFFGIWYLLSVVGIFLTDYVSYYIFHEGTHPVYRKKKKGCAEGEFVIK